MVSVREPRTRARNGALRRIGSFPLFACGATLRMVLSMTFTDPFTPTLLPPTSRCQSPRELCAKQSALRKLIPLGDRILVKRVEVLSQTAGGVFLPESGQKKANEGEVVAVGPGLRQEDGSHQAVDVAIGDKVLLPEFGGSTVTIGDDEMFLFRNNDLLGKFE